jgi:hypothetical protein
VHAIGFLSLFPHGLQHPELMTNLQSAGMPQLVEFGLFPPFIAPVGSPTRVIGRYACVKNIPCISKAFASVSPVLPADYAAGR